MPTVPAESVAACLPVDRPSAAGFDADEFDIFIIDKAGKDSDGVGAAADAGDDHIGQSANLFEALLPGFGTDAGLKMFYDCRIRMRAGRCSEKIKCVGNICRPVAKGIVDGVFECAGSAVDGDNLRAAKFHFVDVDALAFDVGNAHKDFCFHSE